MKEFKVNEYITLKLEHRKTNIYVYNREREKYELFNQCKYVLLRKTVYELEDLLENIESVDDLANNLDHSLDSIEFQRVDLSTETQFWAHCSNIQVWAENNYDSRMLHSNLAFPLLKKLSSSEVGDPLAKKVFKEEIVERYLNGTKEIQQFFVDGKYIELINNVEKYSLFNSFTEEEAIKNLEKKIAPIKLNLDTEYNNFSRSFILREGNVIGLNLIGCKLKRLPPQIRNLQFLETLRIFSNDITELPDWIGEFKFLKVFDISVNKLEKLSNSIGNLGNLKVLNLQINNLQEFPESIGSLSKLEVLRVYHNNLKTLPITIGNLQSLKILELDKNKLEELPDSIGNLKLLEKLNIGYNNIRDVPNVFKNLKNLKKIILFKNPIPKKVIKSAIFNDYPKIRV